MQLGELGIQTSNLLNSRRPALPPELQLHVNCLPQNVCGNISKSFPCHSNDGAPFFVSMRSTHHARLSIIGRKALLQSCLSQRTDMQRPFSNPFSQRRKSLQVGQDRLFLVCQPHLYLSTNSFGLKLTFKLTVNVEAIRSNGIRSISLFSTV